MDDYGTPELEGCTEILVETRPDLIRRMHAEYLAAGADVIETNTFGGMRATLAEYGLAERTGSSAARPPPWPVRSPTSTPRPTSHGSSPGPSAPAPGSRRSGQIRYEELRDQVAEQARGLIEGGVDVLLLETQFDLLGIKAGMNGCRRAMREVGRRGPAVQIQVTIELTGRMLPGTEIGAALVASTPCDPT